MPTHLRERSCRYLEKRRRLWYAVLDVPVAQRQVLGKKRFVQSLGTDSLSVAKIKVLPVLHAWKLLIEEAKSGVAGAAQFRHYMDDMRKAGVPERDVQEATENLAIDMGDAAVVSFLAATGKIVILAAHLQPFLDEMPDSKTKEAKARHVRVFLSAFTYADEVTTDALEDFVLDNLSHLSTGTQTNHISAFKSFWKYLAKKRLVPRSLEFLRDVVPVAPARTESTKPDDKRAQPSLLKRKHFEPQDYQKLLAGVDLKRKHGEALHSLIQLGAYTGCRIEELCSLKVQDVHLVEEFFTVSDAKTEAGNRHIPIHPTILVLFKNLVATSTDGFLLSGLPEGKHADRSNALGKKFGVLKTSLGYGPCHVFHSFRKGVATQFENAGVAELFAARILGHKITTITYRLYSGGANIETLRPAMSVLKW